MNTFAENFRCLLEDSGKTHRELAEILQINVHDIIRWASGTNNYLPSVEKLLKFANYFRCSIDFLLGLTEEDVEPPLLIERPQIAGRFRGIVYESGFTYASLSEKAGIRNTTLFYNWNSGKSMPQAENLVKVASALGCSVDYLVGREK